MIARDEAAAARGRDVRADEGGGDDGRESAGGEMGGGLARMTREGGADVAEAEQADPAGRGGTPCASIYGGCGDAAESSTVVVTTNAPWDAPGDTRVSRRRPAVKSMRASGRP